MKISIAVICLSLISMFCLISIPKPVAAAPYGMEYGQTSGTVTGYRHHHRHWHHHHHGSGVIIHL